MSMTDKEIKRLCEKQAWKFNSFSHRDDLMQEGLLACYELLAGEPDAHAFKVFRAAKKRMTDYINLDVLPVSMPKSRDIEELARSGVPAKDNHLSKRNIDWATNILAAQNSSYDDNVTASDADQAQDFEDKEYADYLYATALSSLTRDEWWVIKLKYYEGLKQTEIADGLNFTQQYMSLIEKNALAKLKAAL